MKKAIIQVSYDGVLSQYCGVGTITRNFTHAVEKDSFFDSFDYYVVTPRYNQDCLNFDQEILEETREICNEKSGDVRFIVDGSDGSEQFGEPENWRVASASAAGQVIDIAQDYDAVYAFYQDTPFMRTPYLVEKQARDDTIRNVFVPHSTGRLQRTHMEQDYTDWIEWEDRNFSKLKSGETRIAYISQFMKRHLSTAYNVEETVPLIDGLEPSLYDASVEEKNGAARIVTFGRSEAYKGLEKLVEEKEFNGKLVVVASDHTSIDPKSSRIAEKAEERNDIHVIDSFIESRRLHRLIASERTRGVIVPSKAEPFGLIPEEARALPGDTVPIASRVGGLEEQIKDGRDGFLFSDIEEMNDKARRVMEMDKERITKINQAGEEKMGRNYLIADNIRESLNLIDQI